MRTIVLALMAAISGTGFADDYPTFEIVKQVVGCMAEIGGQSEETLYTCACRHDVMATRMTFREYEQADLFGRYREMPGKRGALFRDSKNGDALIEKLEAARKEAQAQCPLVKHIGRDTGPQG